MSDIRQFMVSPGRSQLPARNRRVVDSDESDDQQRRVRPRDNPPVIVHPVVNVDDSSDDMYVQRPQAPVAPVQNRTPERVEHHQSQPVQQPRTPRRISTQPHVTHPRTPTPSRRNRNQIIAEAEEASTEAESTTPDESEPDAAELYRAAVMGVRNRPNALQQVRMFILHVHCSRFVCLFCTFTEAT
jgi:hypothetical protein